MADSDLPETGTANEPLTLAEGVGDITELLDEPVEDNDGEKGEKDDDQTDELEADEVEDDDGEDVDEEVDDEEVDEDEDESEPEDYSGGRFAADNAKVTLDDGTTISVGELKRNNLFQRDYTKKTTEHAEAVKTFEATRDQVNQYADTLNQQRDFLLNAQQYFLPQMPQAPDPYTAETDPLAVNDYLLKKDQYEQTMGALNQLYAQQQQSVQQQETQRTQDAEKDYANRQSEILEHHADLREPDKAKAFDREFIDDFLPHYGLSSDEVKGIVDHRVLSVIRDAMAYRKLKTSKPNAKAKLEGKPPLLKSGKRINPQQKISRGKQRRLEKLSKTGSMKDGVVSLIDLDL